MKAAELEGVLFFTNRVGERRASWQSLRTIRLLVLPRFAHESCIKSAIIVREEFFSKKKKQLLLRNDTTLHGVHTDTVAFSPRVLIICCICSDPLSLARVALEWLKKTIHDTYSFLIITGGCGDVPRIIHVFR